MPFLAVKKCPQILSDFVTEDYITYMYSSGIKAANDTNTEKKFSI